MTIDQWLLTIDHFSGKWSMVTSQWSMVISNHNHHHLRNRFEPGGAPEHELTLSCSGARPKCHNQRSRADDGDRGCGGRVGSDGLPGRLHLIVETGSGNL